MNRLRGARGQPSLLLRDELIRRMSSKTNGVQEIEDISSCEDVGLSYIREEIEKIILQLRIVADITDSLKKKLNEVKDSYMELDNVITDLKTKGEQIRDGDDDEEAEEEIEEAKEELCHVFQNAVEEVVLQTKMTGNIIDSLRKSYASMLQKVNTFEENLMEKGIAVEEQEEENGTLEEDKIGTAEEDYDDDDDDMDLEDEEEEEESEDE